MRGSQSAPGRLAKPCGACAASPSRPRRTIVPRSNTRRIPRAFARDMPPAERWCSPKEKDPRRLVSRGSFLSFLLFRAARSGRARWPFGCSNGAPVRAEAARMRLAWAAQVGAQACHPRARPRMAPWVLARDAGDRPLLAVGAKAVVDHHRASGRRFLRAQDRRPAAGRGQAVPSEAVLHPSDQDGSLAVAGLGLVRPSDLDAPWVAAAGAAGRQGGLVPPSGLGGPWVAAAGAVGRHSVRAQPSDLGGPWVVVAERQGVANLRAESCVRRGARTPGAPGGRSSSRAGIPSGH